MYSLKFIKVVKYAVSVAQVYVENRTKKLINDCEY